MSKVEKRKKGEFVLLGKEAKLLKKGSDLKIQMKEIEKELKRIKKELNLKNKGTYMLSDGTIKLVIGEQKIYSEIDSHLLFKYMKGEGMLKHFWTCVKGQITTIKKYVPETRITRWRTELDTILKWSWK